MADLIHRQDAIQLIQHKAWMTRATKAQLIAGIAQLPSAQPERKTGKWVRGDAEKLTCSARCSICQNRVYEERSPYKFCPNCGARMEEDYVRKPD